MALVLIRTRLLVLRRSMGGLRAVALVLGGALGLAAALATLRLGWLPVEGAAGERSAGLLSVALLLWTVGWLLGPLLTGGDATLRLGHFALLPVAPARLAVGLAGAGLAGIGAAATLLGFAGLVVWGARLGAVAGLVAVPAVLAHLGVVVLLAAVGLQALGSAARSRVGFELSTLLLGGVVGFLNTGWFAIGFFQEALGGGAPAAGALRLVPSSWPVVAVAAAGRGDWGGAAAALAGELAVGALLFLAFAGLLARNLVGGGAAAGPARPARPRPLRGGALGAMLGKELRLWARDPRRARNARLAFWVGLATAAAPVLGGFRQVLPWGGVVAALFAGAYAANLYGLDGAAIWVTVSVPGAARADVRGRQLAWLLVAGGPAAAMTLALTAWSGQGWAWPWVLATLPAVLGAGAGLAPLVSLLAPAPSPDRRSASPLDGFGDESGAQARTMGQLVLGLQLAAALPAAAVVGAGQLAHRPALAWAGVPVGVVTGALLGWALGRRAWRRLADRGPELLDALRKGVRRTVRRRVRAAPAGAPAAPRRLALRAARNALLVWTGILLVVPQGLVALALHLAGAPVQGWFLALHLPRAWVVPAALALALAGAAMIAAAARLIRAGRRASRAAAAPADPPR